jgi:hypothetical protein
MENDMPINCSEDSNPLDIIDRNTKKLSALNLLLTDDDISLRLADISTGLYFLLSDIEGQLSYASRRIAANAASQGTSI